MPRPIPAATPTPVPRLVPGPAPTPVPDPAAAPTTRPRGDRLALLGASHRLLDPARELGVDTLLVTTPDRLGLARGGSAAARTLLCDYERDDLFVGLLAALHQVIPFVACVSLTEKGLVPAGRVNDVLALDWPGARTARATRDKALMRRLLAGAGLSPVRTARCEGPAGLMRAAEQVGWPVVCKPADGMASQDVHLARDRAELSALLAADRVPGGALLVEEYLDGPEISVETFSFAGRHVVIAVVDKHLTGGRDGRGDAPFVEIGHVVPARLDAWRTAEVTAAVTALLDVVGVTDGPAHSEIRLTAAGPRVVETHNRVGGDRIPDLVRQVTGVDLFALTVGWAAGRVPALTASPPAVGAAAIRFLAPPPGRVRSVSGLVEPGGEILDAEVTVAPGEVIRPVRHSDDRVGHVIAAGADPAAAWQRAVAAAAGVRFGYQHDGAGR